MWGQKRVNFLTNAFKLETQRATFKGKTGKIRVPCIEVKKSK